MEIWKFQIITVALALSRKHLCQGVPSLVPGAHQYLLWTCLPALRPIFLCTSHPSYPLFPFFSPSLLPPSLLSLLSASNSSSSHTSPSSLSSPSSSFPQSNPHGHPHNEVIVSWSPTEGQEHGGGLIFMNDPMPGPARPTAGSNLSSGGQPGGLLQGFVWE